MIQMTLPFLDLPRSSPAAEDPWSAPAAAAHFEMVNSTDGSPAALATGGLAWYDQSGLYLLFRGRDEGEPVATYRAHDEPLYEEDVFEAFLAPESLTDYFEIEVNPLGATFDARIHSPHGSRVSMTADVGWECRGLRTAVRTEGDENGRLFEAFVVIPFEGLGVTRPQPGAIWRANFYRIDRSKVRGDSYSAWSPTLKSPADFHVPGRFGELRFG